jgi:uracil-DNA glycosylase family 4
MSNCTANLLPEDPTPLKRINCSECGLDRHGTRMVWREGNPEASIFVVLDNPGAHEDRNGNPFVCGTRETLLETVKEVGLRENDFYITYILKRRPIRKYEKETVRQICFGHLEEQLRLKKPLLVICLANVSVQSFFQDSNADVKSLRDELHDVRGYQTIVAYHPLAVRRRPNLRSAFLDDWRLVAKTYLNKA